MDHLPTEARNPASTHLDELSSLQLVRLLNGEDARIVPALATQAEVLARAIDLIAARLSTGGRLVYVGAGTSGRLGVLDAAECPPTFNTDPGMVLGLIAGGPAALTRAVEGAEDHPEAGEQDLRAIGLGSADVVVGIATSGRTPYVLGAMAFARGLGAATIGLSCNPGSELERAVDLAIVPVVGPEVLSGSTRLKAGTATKLVLNLLSTGAMVRLGKTFGNLMVDLRATNSKLRARANRIVRAATGLDAANADRLLHRCDGEVKTALVTHLAQVVPAQARERLQQARGRLRQALTALDLTAPAPGPNSPPLLLGIDGGGSQTTAVLALVRPDTPNGWVPLGQGEAGPSNIQSRGPEMAFRALDEAVDRAFAAANRRHVTVEAACLGLAGADRPIDQDLIHGWAGRRGLARRLEVTSDAALLLAAGTPEGWGVAVIAGTGSIALGRSRAGRTARAGGWGYLLGDEGSGYALARAALKAVTHAADGRGEPTTLTERLLAHMQLQKPQELVPAVYRGTWDRAALATLAPLVLEVAQAGDRVASAILEAEAAALADTVAAVVRQLDLAPIPLVLAGGLLLGSDSYGQTLLASLANLGIHAATVTRVSNPAAGAVALALGTLGHQTDRTSA